MAEAVHSEKIGQLADRVDNLVHALQLPLPPVLHVQQLREVLLQIRDALRLVYTEQMGEDHWETPPPGVAVPGEGGDAPAA